MCFTVLYLYVGEVAGRAGANNRSDKERTGEFEEHGDRSVSYESRDATSARANIYSSSERCGLPALPLEHLLQGERLQRLLQQSERESEPWMCRAT